MKILVTGANGYLGTGIVSLLICKGHEVIATDLVFNRPMNSAKSIEANLFDIENPYDYFGRPQAIIHLAWRDGFEHNSIRHMQDLPKHYEFIQKLISEGIEQVCILGSMHEVGFIEGSINEQTATNPLSLYGISKNALRQSVELCKMEYDFVFQWIRGFYIVGNTGIGCSIFSKISAAEQKGEKFFPFTTGENQYDFISYKEFCCQVVSVVEQRKINGIINCCSGQPEKLRNRVERFIKENGYSIKLNYGEFADRPYDSKAVWGDNKKIRMIMGDSNKNE